MKLCIIAFNQQHFKHICHLYRIEHDQAYYIHTPDQLRAISPTNIIIFGDEWWRGKTAEDIKIFEEMVKIHNERRKEKNNGKVQ